MADTHWPTPPPGPQASPAKVILEKDIKRVRVPAVPGAISWIVQPLAMSIPRFPPVPSSSFRSPEGVLIVSDAGWIDATVQLVYEPVDLDDSRVRPPGSGQKLRQVFDLRAFDHRANRIDLKSYARGYWRSPSRASQRPSKSQTFYSSPGMIRTRAGCPW